MQQTISILMFIGLIIGLSFSAKAQSPYGSEPLAHTYSIVAIDPETGDMGVAVQSHWFSVGSLVIWGEAGVGVVATQSFVNPALGPTGLELLKAGFAAPQALKGLVQADPGQAVRQLAILDAKGNVATHTGSKCIEEAGHLIGEGFSVQANMMLNAKVWPAMAEAFEKSKDKKFADRLLLSLEAAEKAGGDIRGKQSAAILIVKAKSTGKVWEDRLVDLRVDDSPEPLKELRRLWNVQQAYTHMNEGDLAMEKNDVEGALKSYGAAEAMFPDNEEMKFWHAVALVNIKKTDDAMKIFKEIFAKNKNWQILIPRIKKSGLINIDEVELKKIMAL
jgi:uncharacterized Ntn-hydrolase superfamily protein